MHFFTVRDIVLTLDRIIYQNFIGGAEFHYDVDKISEYSVNLCEEHFAYVIRELISSANGVDVIDMEVFDDREYFYFKAKSSTVSSMSEEVEEQLIAAAKKAGLEFERDGDTVTLKALVFLPKSAVFARSSEELFAVMYSVFFGYEYRRINW